ncbi:hypothetical protein C8J57DRAFT_1212200 [Mycena rebaudengoi]|nr:hypothetical protein C8J57DRAFT_1212200 [Mycena rebaudengoi]
MGLAASAHHPVGLRRAKMHCAAGPSAERQGGPRASGRGLVPAKRPRAHGKGSASKREGSGGSFLQNAADAEVDGASASLIISRKLPSLTPTLLREAGARSQAKEGPGGSQSRFSGRNQKGTLVVGKAAIRAGYQTPDRQKLVKEMG